MEFNWDEHKSNLFLATEEAMKNAINKLEPKDKICAIGYYISDADYITITFDTLFTRTKMLTNRARYLREKTTQDNYLSLRHKTCDLRGTYHYLFGLMFHDEIFGFWGEEIEHDADAPYYEEYLNKSYTHSIETQLNLKESKFITKDNFTDLVELLYVLGEGPILLNGIITRDR